MIQRSSNATLLRYDTSTFEAILADVSDLLPSQTNLLEKLSELVSTANLINIVQDSPNSLSYNDRSLIVGDRGNLILRLCVECEEQLTEIFGSLHEQS